MPFSPEAERQMAERKTRGQRWLEGEELELFDGRYSARTIGLMAELTPGMEVWTVEHGRRDAHGEPLGGIVLHVDSGGPNTFDEETGEVVTHPTRFRCYDPLAPWPYRSFQTFAEDELCPASIAVPPQSDVVRAIRRFCREAGRQPKGRPLLLDAFDAGLVTDAWRLVVALMGR